MRESLLELIKLQLVDSKLMELEETLGDLPTQVKHLIHDLETLRQGITEKETRLKEIEHERRSLRGNLGTSREHLKKYKDQLMVVTTNRAYDALMAEIDGVKKIIENGEYHLLELDDEEQSLTDELKEQRLQTADKETTLGEQRKQLEAALARTDEETADLEKKREKIVSRIESRYHTTYERIRAARDGRAVVGLSRGSCSVCFNRIPVQKQMEIKAMDKIITCDECGVILYWDEN
ncbi:MAG: C4-type zinc ribbon domain-containing protein [Candidatus Neomarinimicrobiota bacterium]